MYTWITISRSHSAWHLCFHISTSSSYFLRDFIYPFLGPFSRFPPFLYSTRRMIEYLELPGRPTQLPRSPLILTLALIIYLFIMWRLSSVLLLPFGILQSRASPQVSWSLTDKYVGSDFYSGFTWQTIADPTQGRVK